MQCYDIEKHKVEKRKKIPNAITRGAINGIISQFIADVIVSIFFAEDSILIEDVNISTIPAYYAAVAAGMVGATLSLYMDKIAVTVFTTTVYAYVFNLMLDKTGESEFDLNSMDIISDIMISTILIYTLIPSTKDDYYKHCLERHCIESNRVVEDDNFLILKLVIIIVNTFIQSAQRKQDELTES